MTDKELLGLAKEASKNAYVPYSKFAVGAALECRNGKIFTGCNVENAALGDTICAERTACVKAVSEGCREFEAIAIAGGKEGEDDCNYCPPCGVCRQVMAEFADDMSKTLVISAGQSNHYIMYYSGLSRKNQDISFQKNTNVYRCQQTAIQSGNLALHINLLYAFPMQNDCFSPQRVLSYR